MGKNVWGHLVTMPTFPEVFDTVEALTAALGSALDKNAEHRRALEGKDAALEKYRRALEEKDAALQKVNNHLCAVQGELKTCQRALEKKDAHLLNIQEQLMERIKGLEDNNEFWKAREMEDVKIIGELEADLALACEDAKQARVQEHIACTEIDSLQKALLEQAQEIAHLQHAQKKLQDKCTILEEKEEKESNSANRLDDTHLKELEQAHSAADMAKEDLVRASDKVQLLEVECKTIAKERDALLLKV